MYYLSKRPITIKLLVNACPPEAGAADVYSVPLQPANNSKAELKYNS